MPKKRNSRKQQNYIIRKGDVEVKPIALDLCCGLGGWTIGLLAAGWDVIGFDVTAWPGYPSRLVLQDVREVCGRDYPGVKLVCASPPCQEFSYRSFPFKRCRELAANVPPDKSIWEACVRIAQECGAPLVLENVRGAQKYMGKAVAHYGSFYLWGEVPAMLPIGMPEKGFKKPSNPNFSDGSSFRTFYGERSKDVFKKMVGSEKYKSTSRKELSAKAAMIPVELSTWIGQCFLPQEVMR
jgi:site-specific DNA-cytosine methylase